MKLSELKQKLTVTCDALSAPETLLSQGWKTGLTNTSSVDPNPKQSGPARGYEI